MSVTTDNSGVACCGNCGADVVVACSGGCEHPDVQFRKDFIGSLPKPPGPAHSRPIFPRHKKGEPPRILPPKICNVIDCTDEVEAYSGKGQPPKRCTKHKTKRYTRRVA